MPRNGLTALIEKLSGKKVTTILKSPLWVERLEDRLTPDTTFDVTIAGDNGDDATPLAGSLRKAILDANATPGRDTIRFNIANQAETISLVKKPLPAIRDSVIIDATPPNETRVNQQITLDGSNLDPKLFPKANGLVFTFSVAFNPITGISVSAADNSRVFGLTVQKFTGDGILLQNVHDTQIGGTGDKQENAFLANGNGIHVTGARATGNVITTNYVGVQHAFNGGEAGLGNKGSGVLLDGSSSKTEVRLSTISGNGGNGIKIVNSAGNWVFQNTIGLSEYFGIVARPNQENGILIAGNSPNNTIGGPMKAREDGRYLLSGGNGNVISGNKFDGIQVNGGGGGNVLGTRIVGNYIGPDSDGNDSPLDPADEEQKLSNHIGIYLVDIPNPENPNVLQTVKIHGNLISGNTGGVDGGGIILNNASKTEIWKNVIGRKQDIAGNSSTAVARRAKSFSTPDRRITMSRATPSPMATRASPTMQVRTQTIPSGTPTPSTVATASPSTTATTA